MNLPPEKKMVHALYCKCGVQYHVSTLDNALQSKDWNKEVRSCLGAGGYAETFDMNDKPLRLYKGKCTCGMLTT